MGEHEKSQQSTGASTANSRTPGALDIGDVTPGSPMSGALMPGASEIGDSTFVDPLPGAFTPVDPLPGEFGAVEPMISDFAPGAPGVPETPESAASTPGPRRSASHRAVSPPHRGVTISGRALAVIVLVAALLVGGGVVVGLHWNEWFGAGGTARQADLDEDAVDWAGAGEERTLTGDGQPGIAIPGYQSITLKADTLDQQVNLFNPDGNDCYFVMSLILPDGTVIWTSKMVEPGKGLYSITLTSRLRPARTRTARCVTSASSVTTI